MPLTHLICPDEIKIPVEQCLTYKGCRLCDRCAPMSVLRQVSERRKWRGVTASQSGNGPRIMYLPEIVDFSIKPESMAFAFLGINTHSKMAEEQWTDNVMPEQRFKEGTSDVLEIDEFYPEPDHYILYDYKTSGSYAIAKWAGIQVIKEDRPILDADGNAVLLKSGPNKGKVKTKQHREIVEDFSKGNRREISLQLNRYRQAWNAKGFKISKMYIFGIPRDGGTYLAEQRGITKRFYKFPVEFMPDLEVTEYYENLAHEMDVAFKTGYARPCNPWETWEGERCRRFCDVSIDCIEMCRQYSEQWPGGDWKKHRAEKGYMINA